MEDFERSMKHILFLGCFLFLFTNCYPQPFQQQKTVNWSLAGNTIKPGAFLKTVNFLQAGGQADGTAANNAVMKRLLDSLAGDTAVIYFPKGKYLFTEPVKIAGNITLRGHSADSTQLIFNLAKEDHAIKIQGSMSKTESLVLRDIYKDSVSIAVANTSLFKPGDYIKITENDADFITSAWANGYTGQIVKIAAVNGEFLALASPLRRDFHISKGVKIVKLQMAQNVGIENLKIQRLDATADQTSNIIFKYAANCYVKCIESHNANFAHVELNSSTNIEVTGSYFHHAFDYGNGGKGYGVLVHLTTGESLVKDNIFNTLRHAILLQAGANGNVIAYNYSINPTWSGVMLPSNSAGDIVLHGNYPYANLFEGNVAQNIVIDNSHGKNGPLNTFFRNRAELYGIVMNNNAGNEQVFIGNEISGKGMFMGNYSLTGTGHYEYANNKTGSILPTEVDELNRQSLFLTEAPEYYKAKAAWPPIGFPNKINTHKIQAQELYSKGIFTNCAIIYTKQPADTTVLKDTVIIKDTTVAKDTSIIIKDTTDISGSDTTSSIDTVTTWVFAGENLQKQINIFPNPANEFIRLDFGGSAPLSIREARLMSVSGQEKQLRFIDSQADTSNLKDGLYLLRIHFSNDQTIVKKLLKHSY